ncbi:MAG: hypothetical protein PHI71_08435 [Acidiphilium sp.]|nr:hypothetical protein [Acidiphilium sp.]
MSTDRHSLTARRISVRLDAADPREAAALAALDQLQAAMPARVRAGLMRDALCRVILDLAAGGAVAVDQPSATGPARRVRAGRAVVKTATVAKPVPVGGDPVPVEAAPGLAESDPGDAAPVVSVAERVDPVDVDHDENKPAGGTKPGGLMW